MRKIADKPVTPLYLKSYMPKFPLSHLPTNASNACELNRSSNENLPILVLNIRDNKSRKLVRERMSSEGIRLP